MFLWTNSNKLALGARKNSYLIEVEEVGEYEIELRRYLEKQMQQLLEFQLPSAEEK